MDTTELKRQTQAQLMLERVLDISALIDYRDDSYRWDIDIDRADGHRVFVQVKHYRPDANTGELDWGFGGKRYLSPFQTDSEIIRVFFSTALAYEEHEVREHFRWSGRQVFGPHIDVTALWSVAGVIDVRTEINQ